MFDVAPLADHINIEACTQVVPYYKQCLQCDRESVFICGGKAQAGNFCKPGSLALTRMAVGRDGLSEEVTEVFIGRRTNSNAYG